MVTEVQGGAHSRSVSITKLWVGLSENSRWRAPNSGAGSRCRPKLRAANAPQALLDLPNAALLPHVGPATECTRRATANLCVDNPAAWFSERRTLTAAPETAHIRTRGSRAR
jgi:hypothetical protein